MSRFASAPLFIGSTCCCSRIIDPRRPRDEATEAQHCPRWLPRFRSSAVDGAAVGSLIRGTFELRRERSQAQNLVPAATLFYKSTTAIVAAYWSCTPIYEEENALLAGEACWHLAVVMCKLFAAKSTTAIVAAYWSCTPIYEEENALLAGGACWHLAVVTCKLFAATTFASTPALRFALEPHKREEIEFGDDSVLQQQCYSVRDELVGRIEDRDSANKRPRIAAGMRPGSSDDDSKPKEEILCRAYLGGGDYGPPHAHGLVIKSLPLRAAELASALIHVLSEGKPSEHTTRAHHQLFLGGQQTPLACELSDESIRQTVIQVRDMRKR